MHTFVAARWVSLSLVLSAPVFAGNERALTVAPTSATCSCKHAGECTCPKGKCECKGCGHNSTKLFDALGGKTERTVLPNTARREDARGGVFI